MNNKSYRLTLSDINKQYPKQQTNQMIRKNVTIVALLVHLLLQVVHSYDWHFNVSIQNSSETFTAYIPYFQGCDYSNEPAVEPGQIQQTNITQQSFFSGVKYAQNVVFWYPVKDGLDIMLRQTYLLSGYDGMILYDSQIYDNRTRHVILYQFENGQLNFTYCIPYVDMKSGAIQKSITRQRTLNFTPQIQGFLNDCGSENLLISYYGWNQFLAACKNLPGVIYWEEYQDSQAIFQDSLPIDYPLKDIISNPLLISNPIDQAIEYRVMILSALSESEDTSYFCNSTTQQSEQGKFTNLTQIECISLYESEIEIFNIIDQLWGSLSTIQKYKIEQVIESLSSISSQFSLPGTIVSIFISYTHDMYIESVTEQTSYLIIIREGGELFVNITFQGRIFYYGQENIIVQNMYHDEQKKVKITYYAMEIILPMFFIPSYQYPQKEFSFAIQCPNNVQLNFYFQVFWSSFDYPTANVINTQTIPTDIDNQVLTYKLSNYFQVIGPAFDVFIYENSTQLQTTILDFSIITLEAEFLSILDYIDVIRRNKFQNQLISSRPSQNSKPAESYLLLTTPQGIVKQPINPSKKGTLVKKAPCGIKQLLKGQKMMNRYYFQSSLETSGQYCVCTLNLKQCKSISSQQFLSAKSHSQLRHSRKASNLVSFTKPSSMSQTNNESSTNQSTSVPKKYLVVDYLLMDFLMITIYTNNSLVLINTTSNEQLYWIDMHCTTPNSTNGGVFIEDFEDPVLIAYCEGYDFVKEYMIRKSQLVFTRKIPLYGFHTKADNLYVGTTYVFIGVSTKLPRYDNQSCCVLRLRPSEYTVSVIKEIIPETNLTLLQSFWHVDFAYFQNSQAMQNTSYIKIYYGDTLIALNQSFRTQAIEQYPYNITFVSEIYNFAAVYMSHVQFNLTNAIINYTKPDHNYQAALVFPIESVGTKLPGLEYFTANMSFDYNDVCGPIMWTQFQIEETNQMTEIVDNAIVVNSKILGKQGEIFLQILEIETPYKETMNSSLNNLIMVVGTNNLTFYAKQYDNFFTHYVGFIEPPQHNCKYQLYQYIDPTCAVFITTCQTPNFNLKTPLLILKYNESSLTQKITYNFSTFQLPMHLQNLYVLPRTDILSYIIGLSVGPRFALTGRLYFCGTINCSALYLSSKQTYLVSFDAYNLGQNFVIMSLDGQKIGIWVSISDTNSSLISPNYTIPYNSVVKADCSIIHIVSSTVTSAYIVLSSKLYYFYVQLNFVEQTALLVTRFIRYTNCQTFDNFEPETVAYPNGTLKILIAQCVQDYRTLRLEEVQTLTTSALQIYTGYLQIYSYQGPQCDQITFQTIKIVPLSSDMENRILESYVVNGQSKLMFEKISGLLFDSFVSTQPQIFLRITPLSKVVELPEINMTIGNQYYSLPISLVVERQPFKTELAAYYFLGVFLLANILTIVMIILWFCMEINKGTFQNISQAQKFDSQSEEQVIRTSGGDVEQDYRMSPRPSQIQLFYQKADRLSPQKDNI